MLAAKGEAVAIALIPYAGIDGYTVSRIDLLCCYSFIGLSVNSFMLFAANDHEVAFAAKERLKC